jgi:hypothetical protein
MSPHVPHGLSMRRAVGSSERSRLARLVRTLNSSTEDAYTRCPGHADTAHQRALPVCPCCVAGLRFDVLHPDAHQTPQDGAGSMIT